MSQTYRNSSALQSEVVQIIPRNDRVLSPRSDKSIERRSKSINSSQFAKINHSQHSSSQTNFNISASLHHPNFLTSQQISEQLQRSSALFINQIQKLKSENRQLQYNNNLLEKENQIMKNSMEHDMKKSKQSSCSIEQLKNGIKAIQQRVQYYEAESKANQLYSNCFIQISKCLSKQELTIDQLKQKIMSLMDECQKYKDQIKRLDEICRVKQHNTNEQLQKIIMDFNETVFIKNELQIKIFDLTTQNNSLRTTIYDLNCRLKQQQTQINKMLHQFSNLNTNLSTSNYQIQSSNIHEQTKLNLEHLQRQNEHLKLEIGTYKTKAQHYLGSQFNHKQEINRLNNFISQLDTKWHVQFQHNGVLQQERKHHLRQISRLEMEIQRLNVSLDETRNNQSKIRFDIDSTVESKRIVERQRQMISDELRHYKQKSSELTHINQRLEQEIRLANIKIGRLSDTVAELTRVSQNKQNNYIYQLNSLRQQIGHVQSQWHISNQHLISKEEQMRLICSEINQNSEATLEQIKNQTRLEISRQRSHIKILNDKIKQLETHIETMHKQNLQKQSQLSMKRMLIADLENTSQIKSNQHEQIVKRMETMFNLQRQKLLHSKVLLENEIQLSQSHMKQMQQTMYRLKQNNLKQTHSLNYNNNVLQKTVQQYEILIQTLKSKISLLDNIEMQKNKYQNDCINLQKQINNKVYSIDQLMKKTNQQQNIRRESYQSQIYSLQTTIKKNQDQFQSLRKELDQRISELNYKNNDLQNKLSKQAALLQQQTRLQDQFKNILSQLKKLYSTQLDGLKTDLLSNIKNQWQKYSDKEYEVLLNKYEQRLNNVINCLQKILREDNKSSKREIQELFNREVKSIKDRCVEQANRTRRDVNEFINNQKINEINNKAKVTQLQNKIKSYQQIFQYVSNERTLRINRESQINQRNFFQFELISKENQSLKQTNLKLNSLINSSQQTIMTLRSEISSWSFKYDKFKIQSQIRQDNLAQQIKHLKNTVTDLQKHPNQIGTKTTFTEHDRTINRLTSMPDLTKSTNLHNKSIELRHNINPQISIINEESQRFKTIPNKVVQRTTIHQSPVIVNIIQKGKDEQQKMIHPSASLRTTITNKNNSPRNEKIFNFIPNTLRQQTIHHQPYKQDFVERTNSISPPHKINQNIHFQIRPISIVQVQKRGVSPPRLQILPKPLSPPINTNYRMSTIKPPTSPSVLQFANSSFGSKPTSPNHKQTKLSVTLLNNNILSNRQKSISKQKIQQHSNFKGISDRYCC